MNEMKNKNQEQPKGKSEELSKDKSSVYSASLMQEMRPSA